ncbi:eisosome protein SEG2-like isoform X1 [Colias croceus]|uniref:eisosome protein SEG2-like isoform X1 n=1 Tax=Colias crocea TaxID=72248 RepID=UPI001E2811F2|nr:eisosome protein SEG2-like isoform X1 [Colias croceus]
MGGAVSSGRDNNELIDNLLSGNYIRTRRVEKVFRALDRADYMTPEARDQAYKDLAWRKEPFHLSSPCIYSEVMEGLELKPGLSFLNVGSGTGYLSTLAGLILGTAGISHGVEVHPIIVEYATKKLSQFIENSPSLDDFDFCEPKFFTGNGLCIAPLQCGYDRVYCGAGCPEEYENYFKNLIKVGGILVLPINDTLQQVKRVSENKWVSRSLLNVSFLNLQVPTQEDSLDSVKLAELMPPRLQLLARARVRASMREGVIRRNPELKERPWRRPRRVSCPRKICIPIEPGGEVQNLNVLHDLDSESGANEMNALLSLVISMGQNRVAGALRFDRVARRSNDSDDSDEQTGGSRNGDDDDSSDDDDSDGNDGTDNTVEKSPKTKTDKVESAEEANIEMADETQENKDKAQENTKTDQETENNDKSDKSSEIDKDSSYYKSEDTAKSETSRDKETESHSDQALELIRKLKKKKYWGKKSKKCGKLSRKNIRKSSSDSVDDEKPSTSKEGEDKDNNKKTPRSKTPINEDSSDDDDDKPDSSNPRMPSEVEIYIPKMQEPGTSAEMDWEEARPKPKEGEDNEGVSKSKAKRQKLDSGIGENTPSSSPKSKSDDSEESESDNSDSWETDTEPEPSTGRRRRSSRSSGRSSGRPSLEEVIERAEARRLRQRQRRIARGGDARRVRLSLLMKRAVRELPLPQPLKKFVNWGRCYEF